MAVLVHVPDWLRCHIELRRHDNLVRINLSREPGNVVQAHILLLINDEVLTLDLHAFDESIRSWWITDTLEELDSFLALKILQLPIVTQELLLFLSHANLLHAKRLLVNTVLSILCICLYRLLEIPLRNFLERSTL